MVKNARLENAVPNLHGWKIWDRPSHSLKALYMSQICCDYSGYQYFDAHNSVGKTLIKSHSYNTETQDYKKRSKRLATGSCSLQPRQHIDDVPKQWTSSSLSVYFFEA